MKNKASIGVSLLLLVTALATLLPIHAQKTASQAAQVGAGDSAPPLSNPLKVALLKWYKANVVTTFPTGTEPVAIAFDGENIWVGNNVSATVNKLRANDGAPLGSFSVWDPNGICFDGANIWVTSYRLGYGRGGSKPEANGEKRVGMDNTVSKLRASDGKVMGTFNTGQGPQWPTFDGEHIWIPNSVDNTVSKLRVSDGVILGTFPVGVSPVATAFDGANIWVANYTGFGNGTVTKLREDGRVLGTFTVGEGPLGIAFDGANMWVANANDGTVSKLRASDGTTLGTFSVGGDSPAGVAFDGENIWLAGDALIELRASDGNPLLALKQPGNSSKAIAFDGANIWVTLLNAAKVGKI